MESFKQRERLLHAFSWFSCHVVFQAMEKRGFRMAWRIRAARVLSLEANRSMTVKGGRHSVWGVLCLRSRVVCARIEGVLAHEMGAILLSRGLASF